MKGRQKKRGKKFFSSPSRWQLKIVGEFVWFACEETYQSSASPVMENLYIFVDKPTMYALGRAAIASDDCHLKRSEEVYDTGQTGIL